MSVARATSGRAAAEPYLHKLSAPQTFADAVHRRGILERLAGSDSARVVFLQGPAGHGKTTALQQIKAACAAEGAITGWLTLDRADNDLRRFSIHLRALLAGVRREAGLPATEATENDDRRRRSDWLIAELASTRRPVALFLDDFQTLEDALILSFFREFLERLPAPLRVFVGSRSIPEIGLSRLTINRQAMVLRAESLRFSESEVVEFFGADDGLDLRREEIAAIYRRCDGWPAALQLFRLALVSPAVRGALGDLAEYRPRELAEYLAENVLGLQTPAVQDFLRKTSVLTTLTAPVCDAVTGRDDAQAMLSQLERSGLFVHSLDSDPQLFRYHPLFASFLVDQLAARGAPQRLDVHRRAARWYQSQGQHEETVRHALACGDSALAADTLARWCVALVADGQLATVESWCGKLAFAEIAARPLLTIELAYALMFQRRFAKLKPLLALLREELTHGEAPGRDPTMARIALSMAAICADEVGSAFGTVEGLDLRATPGERFGSFAFGAAANLLAKRAMTLGDFETARELLALARAHNARGGAAFSSGYTTACRGVHRMAQGRLQEALAAYREGMADPQMRIDNSFAAAALASCQIWALYEANALDRVEALFGQYRELIAASCLLDFVAVAFLAMARTHEARGRRQEALALLDEAETLGHTLGWPRLVQGIHWERVRRAVQSGARDRAMALAAHAPSTPSLAPAWVLFSQDFEDEALGRIRLAIHLEEFDEAAGLLAREGRRHPDRLYRHLKLALLEAQLHAARGQHVLAQRSLRRALRTAEAGGFVRVFLDEGEPVLRLLREAYQMMLESTERADAGSERRFVETLLQGSGMDLSHRPSPLAATTALTEREREILAFLANGVSNKEMASRVFLSENTVKFHLKNIYAKLEVGTRVQAINAARERGLIH